MNAEVHVDLIERDRASNVRGGAGERLFENPFVPTQEFSVSDTVASLEVAGVTEGEAGLSGAGLGIREDAVRKVQSDQGGSSQ